MMPANIDFAIEALLEEVEYQGEVWADTRPLSESGSGAFDRSLDEYTLYINRYAQRMAAENCTDEQAFRRKLHTARKIAALAIACLAQHGLATREQEQNGF